MGGLENYGIPPGRRLVKIDLTPEQAAALEPREVGRRNGKPLYEECGETWLEIDIEGGRDG